VGERTAADTPSSSFEQRLNAIGGKMAVKRVDIGDAIARRRMSWGDTANETVAIARNDCLRSPDFGHPM
jgi:hypothetical protein